MTTFDSTGASIDSYAETRQKIADKITAVLGVDMAVDNEDSVIGKIITIAATVADEANQNLQQAVAVRDPDSATGTGLAKLVKLNGITKNAAEYSTVALTVHANAYGTSISKGDKVYNENTPDILWAIDSDVTVAAYGSETVSATCETAGAIPALPGTLTKIKNPRQGWSWVTNDSAASIGATTETDPALRRRRERVARSYGKTTLYGVWAALEDYDQVTDVFVHQNNTNEEDGFGTPARTIHAFVRGGEDAVIAEILFRTCPCLTYGTTTVAHEYRGNSHSIKFSRPTDTPITVAVTMAPISTTSPLSFPSISSATLKKALVDFVAANQLMGVDAIPQQLMGACSGLVAGYYVASVTINGSSAVVPAEMGEAFTLSEDDITVTL